MPNLAYRVKPAPSNQTLVTKGEETFAAILGVVQFYPLRDGGLWLKAGGGYAESAVDFFDPDFFDTSESGFAWSVGAGYEIQLSRSIAIGPSVEFYQGSFSRRDEPTLTERVLNDNAVVAAYASMAAPAPVLPFYPLMFRNVTLRLVALQTVPLEMKVAAATEISRWCAGGALRHPPLHVLPLEAIVEAHELVESGTVIGKVVLEIK